MISNEWTDVEYDIQQDATVDRFMPLMPPHLSEQVGTYLAKKEEDIVEYRVYPVTSEEYIDKIAEYLLYRNTKKESPKYTNRRDCAMWIIGINLSLRCSDLIKMKVRDFLEVDERGKMRWALGKKICEQKTSKVRELWYNNVVISAVAKWVTDERLDPNDYLFRSNRPWTNESGEKCEYVNRRSYGARLREAGEAVGYPLPISTHSMRKTFVYHRYVNCPDEKKADMIVQLQRLLKHSSPLITMRYIGFNDEDVKNLYNDVNLGKIIF